MARPARIPISRVRLAILYSEQGGCCCGCFKAFGEDVHVDHVEPLARGGLDAFENLQLPHRACNQAKGTLGAAEWFARHWRAFVRTQRRPGRQKVTVTFEHELVERRRLRPTGRSGPSRRCLRRARRTRCGRSRSGVG